MINVIRILSHVIGIFLGSFDGEIYCTTVYSSDGRTAGAELGEQHVCDRRGEDQRVGVLPKRFAGEGGYD